MDRSWILRGDRIIETKELAHAVNGDLDDMITGIGLKNRRDITGIECKDSIAESIAPALPCLSGMQGKYARVRRGAQRLPL